MQEQGVGLMGSSTGGGIGGLGPLGDVSMVISEDNQRQLKGEIATHPLYEQLLSAHVACLRVATPIDQLPLIEAQFSQSHHLLRSYASQHHSHSLSPHERQELDNFLVCFNFPSSISFVAHPFFSRGSIGNGLSVRSG